MNIEVVDIECEISFEQISAEQEKKFERQSSRSLKRKKWEKYSQAEKNELLQNERSRQWPSSILQEIMQKDWTRKPTLRKPKQQIREELSQNSDSNSLQSSNQIPTPKNKSSRRKKINKKNIIEIKRLKPKRLQKKSKQQKRSKQKIREERSSRIESREKSKRINASKSKKQKQKSRSKETFKKKQPQQKHQTKKSEPQQKQKKTVKNDKQPRKGKVNLSQKLIIQEEDIGKRYALIGMNKTLRENFEKQVVRTVPGRSSQALNVFELILKSENGSSSPICLHGNTGCGKTSLIRKILGFVEREFPKKFSTAYLNCMSMWSVNHVYSAILYKLFGYTQKKTERALNELFLYSQQAFHPKLSKKEGKLDSERHIQNMKKTKLIVLDEIDHFIKDQNFIYNLLEWAQLRDSKIILILISNIIDLSVYLSSKLQSRLKCQAIIFKPYDYTAIEEILHYKYPEAKNLFESKAIGFLCRKVASINSDIRLLEKLYSQIISSWEEREGLEDDASDIEEEKDPKKNFSIVAKSEKLSKIKKDEQYKNLNAKQGVTRLQNSYKEERNRELQQEKRSTRKLNKKRMQKYEGVKVSNLITIKEVSESMFLAGQTNGQVPEILEGYEIMLKVLNKCKKKQEVSYQIMNKTFLRDKKIPSSQQILLQLCELKDFGLIDIVEDTKFADATFQGFGIIIKEQLRFMCPED